MVIKFSEERERILIGRSNDSDVNIKDNKISRFQAFARYFKDKNDK